MAQLRIVEWPAKVLESRASEVTQFDDELRQFAKDMHETMALSGGIGLAANQVGDLRRVIVITISHSNEDDEKREDWHDKPFTLVNPKILKSQGKIKWQEGCLSFPGIYEWIERKEEVWVEAQDETGKTFQVHGTGLFAVCLQHEIDHLDGICFITRMSRLKAALVRKKVIARGILEEVEGS